MGTVQEFKIWPYKQTVYAQLESDLEHETHQIIWDIDIHQFI